MNGEKTGLDYYAVDIRNSLMSIETSLRILSLSALLELGQKVASGELDMQPDFKDLFGRMYESVVQELDESFTVYHAVDGPEV